jgi:NADH:quinone reductase (non-electrogenic)
MGTRFLATKERWVHENVKQAMVRGTERDTQIVFRRLRNSSRLFKNAITKELAALGCRSDQDLRGHEAPGGGFTLARGVREG